jgi:hypothetical protein
MMPIVPSLRTAWLIAFDDGRRVVSIWSDNACIQKVVASVRAGFLGARFPRSGFRVSNIDVGAFEVQTIISSYASDSRRVNDRLEVVL